MKALVVGSGSMGRRHRENLSILRPDADIAVLSSRAAAGIVTPSPDSTELTELTDLSGALRWQPDVAVVASPAPHHLPVALALVERGVPVLVEKPLSHSLEGIDELQAVAARTDTPVLVGYCLRFDPCYEELRAALSGGRIGRLVWLRCQVGSYLPTWRSGVDHRSTVTAQAELGGGALLELSHEIDLALALGGPARQVQAVMVATGELDIDVEDVVELCLEQSGEVVGSVHLDLLRRPPMRITQLVGTEGVLTWDLLAGVVTAEDTDGVVEEVFRRPSADRNDVYLEELRHFLACAAGTEQPRCSLAEGRAVVEVCDLARVGGGAVGGGSS